MEALELFMRTITNSIRKRFKAGIIIPQRESRSKSCELLILNNKISRHMVQKIVALYI